jgi:hypothetical protein
LFKKDVIANAKGTYWLVKIMGSVKCLKGCHNK